MVVVVLVGGLVALAGFVLSQLIYLREKTMVLLSVTKEINAAPIFISFVLSSLDNYATTNLEISHKRCG